MRKTLLKAAREASRYSYSPYSHFPVGAAVLTSDGRIFTGCNVEGATYTTTIHAEMTALVKAISEGAGRIVALAVCCAKGDKSKPHTLMPCGICRQMMCELLGRDTVIWVDGLEQEFCIEDLLPQAFSL